MQPKLQMKKKILSALFLICLFSMSVKAQETTENKKEIDPSNPTNLYTQINGTFEYQSFEDNDVYGMKFNVQYAFNPDNLMLVDLPIRHNEATNKTGLGDMRVRYYHVAKKGITKKFVAIVPYLDFSIPVGSYENGLGSSSWSLGAGLLCGFVFNPKLSFFPSINYSHITKPGTDLILDANKYSSDGIGLQFNTTYKFTKRTFMSINPSPSFRNKNGSWKTTWEGDLNFNHIVTPNKFKINAGWSPNFTDNVNVYRIGATIYI
jgi:hypothetical protein